jgi:hypothetical protein
MATTEAIAILLITGDGCPRKGFDIEQSGASA